MLQLWAQDTEGQLWDARERARRIVEEHRVGVERFALRLAQDEELKGEELRSALVDARSHVSPGGEQAMSGPDEGSPGTS